MGLSFIHQSVNPVDMAKKKKKEKKKIALSVFTFVQNLFVNVLRYLLRGEAQSLFFSRENKFNEAALYGS